MLFALQLALWKLSFPGFLISLASCRLLSIAGSHQGSVSDAHVGQWTFLCLQTDPDPIDSLGMLRVLWVWKSWTRQWAHTSACSIPHAPHHHDNVSLEHTFSSSRSPARGWTGGHRSKGTAASWRAASTGRTAPGNQPGFSTEGNSHGWPHCHRPSSATRSWEQNRSKL